MTKYDKSKTTVDITKGNPVSRKCGKCGKDLKDGDEHVCKRCLLLAAAGKQRVDTKIHQDKSEEDSSKE